ncbi:hypothetical protein JAAARDRAFT_469697 [Jaapia argillacea MUCL 33604]|uniref:Uncharacterized protein n=1 Tax=Jaapia argillacea MUCL 33604 TaxID=933084 RepID=A0A067Q6X2_9AGAM|nr:hypothetical protein JAAARDRAFT_469697 [Jaapia argillacea MUCL 33604]
MSTVWIARGSIVLSSITLLITSTSTLLLLTHALSSCCAKIGVFLLVQSHSCGGNAARKARGV